MKYGHTPWDDMSKEDLLLEVWRLYKAAESAKSCIELHKVYNPMSGFWSDEGTGGRALNMIDEAMSTVSKMPDNEREKLWYGFFRNALPLLFECAKKSGWDWIVCEKCDCWTSGKQSVESCIKCGNTDLRPIKWSDFRK